jgi:hypothetical protein
MSEVTYRWVDGPTASNEDWEKIDSLLAIRGWMSLNRATSRVYLAEDVSTGEVKGFFALQLMPFLGPLYVVPSERGSGLAETLADDMQTFLEDCKYRGGMTIADSPIVGKMCEARGMKRVESPVFVAGGV